MQYTSGFKNSGFRNVKNVTRKRQQQMSYVRVYYTLSQGSSALD